MAVLIDLHNQLPQNMQNPDLVKNISQKLEDIGNKIANLQAVLQHVPASAEKGYYKLRKQVSKGLNNQRKKYKLALESLGWGTLADLLEAAFGGKILNIFA